jgi:D-alanyl-D-alanine carboxypeptidase
MPALHSRRSLLTTGPAMLALPIAAGALSRIAAVSAAPRFQATPVSTAALDGVLADAVAQGQPGVALQVERDGETLYSDVAGVSSIERDTPVTASDRFRIYSITKTFTAIITLQLVDEGVITLEETVTDWLDHPDVSAIPNVDQITIRQLLTHASGIYDFVGDPTNEFYADAFFGAKADWTRVWTPYEVLAYVAGDRQEPYFEPGEGTYYSNSGYFLLGLIIEAATGRTYAEELSDRILRPLQLDDTELAEGKTLPENVVDGYQLIEGQLINVSAVNLSWVWAAGGIVSTTADLARFANELFAGELLSPASQAEMFTFAPEHWAGYYFGMGVYRREMANGAMIGMDGGAAGGNAVMLKLEDRDLTAIALVNMDPAATFELVDEAISWALAQSS